MRTMLDVVLDSRYTVNTVDESLNMRIGSQRVGIAKVLYTAEVLRDEDVHPSFGVPGEEMVVPTLDEESLHSRRELLHNRHDLFLEVCVLKREGD